MRQRQQPVALARRQQPPRARPRRRRQLLQPRPLALEVGLARAPHPRLRPRPRRPAPAPHDPLLAPAHRAHEALGHLILARYTLAGAAMARAAALNRRAERNAMRQNLRDAALAAAERGDLEALHSAALSSAKQVRRECATRACHAGHVHVLEWLYLHGLTDWSDWRQGPIDTVCLAGAPLPTIAWLRRKFPRKMDGISSKIFMGAVRTGRVDALEHYLLLGWNYFHIPSFRGEVLEMAVRHVAVLDWLYDRALLTEADFASVLRRAVAACGPVEWFCRRGLVPTDPAAAADVLKLSRASSAQMFPLLASVWPADLLVQIADDVLPQIASSGDPRRLELYRNACLGAISPERFIQLSGGQTIRGAIRGAPPVLDWLVSVGHDAASFSAARAVSEAVKYRRVDVLDWLDAHGMASLANCREDNCRPFRLALEGNTNHAVLDWLAARGAVNPQDFATIGGADRWGQEKWLRRHGLYS